MPRKARRAQAEQSTGAAEAGAARSAAGVGEKVGQAAAPAQAGAKVGQAAVPAEVGQVSVPAQAGAKVGQAAAPAQAGMGAGASEPRPSGSGARPDRTAQPPSLAGRGKGRVETAGAHQRPSALLDTRVTYCGDCLDRLRKLRDACIDRTRVWHRLPAGESNSNRNYEVFWSETKEKRAFEDRHASTAAYPGAPGRPRCVELARVLKKTGSFYYHCDWHAGHDHRGCSNALSAKRGQMKLTGAYQ